jgi:aminoglycoside phosphotransferase (APT) family kinase protein
VTGSDNPAGLDLVALAQWCDSAQVEVPGPFAARLLAGGRSNLTYALTSSDGSVCVLRRPPLGTLLATAHDMAREYRVLSSVHPAGIPVARPIALCQDPSVIGADFYLMELVDGLVLDSQGAGEALDLAARAVASEQLIDRLADLHALDVDAIGLGDFAKRTGHLDRQLLRWTRQWEGSATREIAEIDEVHRRLAAVVPGQQRLSVVHGDYRFGNVMVDRDGSVKAILDWELCTLGDPLVDVGWLSIYWSNAGEEPRQFNDPTGIEGFSSRSEAVDRYARRTGLDLSDLAWYTAFSFWRLAVISEGVYARYRNGQMGVGASDLEVLASGAPRLARLALASLDA